jgi:hypothetical protein
MRQKAARERPGTFPIIKMPRRRDSEDPGREGLAVLQLTSRFRAHDDVEDSGHVYLTARYPTRFD